MVGFRDLVGVGIAPVKKNPAVKFISFIGFFRVFEDKK